MSHEAPPRVSCPQCSGPFLSLLRSTIPSTCKHPEPAHERGEPVEFNLCTALLWCGRSGNPASELEASTHPVQSIHITTSTSRVTCLRSGCAGSSESFADSAAAAGSAAGGGARELFSTSGAEAISRVSGRRCRYHGKVINRQFLEIAEDVKGAALSRR